MRSGEEFETGGWKKYIEEKRGSRTLILSVLVVSTSTRVSLEENCLSSFCSSSFSFVFLAPYYYKMNKFHTIYL